MRWVNALCHAMARWARREIGNQETTAYLWDFCLAGGRAAIVAAALAAVRWGLPAFVEQLQAQGQAAIAAEDLGYAALMLTLAGASWAFVALLKLRRCYKSHAADE